MKWYRHVLFTVWMAKDSVRASLPDFVKASLVEYPDYFSGF
jgi:hypothetical protein